MSSNTFRTSIRSPLLGTLKLGADLQAKLAKATKLTESDGSGSRSIGYDLNGDGAADVWESDVLDANGKVTARGLTVYSNGGSYSAADNNGDGKIDTLSRSTATGYSLLSDNNGDGKADYQYDARMKNGLQTSSRSLQDSNFDGKADFFGVQRKATSRDVFDAAPAQLASLPGIGGDLGGVVPASAHQVGWSEGASYATKSWDTNGDWSADLSETDSLDANRNVVARSISVNVPAAADGSGGGAITLSDGNNDGKVDWVSLYGNDGSSYSLSDNDRDGKVDSRTESKTVNGVSTTLIDSDGNGKADQVSSWTRLA